MDLESSLGKIEDSNMNNLQDPMVRNEPSTRTSSTYPFKLEHMNIEPLESSPYPLRVTDSERRERESLTESSQNFHLVLQKGVAEADMGSISDEDEWGLDPSETEDDDSRYFLEQEAIKMTRSGLELENIADPMSFWEG
jgi:hypothetical protein